MSCSMLHSPADCCQQTRPHDRIPLSAKAQCISNQGFTNSWHGIRYINKGQRIHLGHVREAITLRPRPDKDALTEWPQKGESGKCLHAEVTQTDGLRDSVLSLAYSVTG